MPVPVKLHAVVSLRNPLNTNGFSGVLVDLDERSVNFHRSLGNRELRGHAGDKPVEDGLDAAPKD